MNNWFFAWLGLGLAVFLIIMAFVIAGYIGGNTERLCIEKGGEYIVGDPENSPAVRYRYCKLGNKPEA